MSLGYFLILATLILGGLIATLGDRIGTKVGKARLSLFNLRPKKTAVLITILTGILIAASTVGLLLLVSRGTRDRLINFEEILKGRRKDLEKVQADLDQVAKDKTTVQQELTQAREERLRVKEQLDKINQSLKGAVDRQRQTESLRQRIETQRNQIQAQYLRVSSQANALRTDIGQLQSDQAMLVAQRDRIAAQIATRDQALAQQEQSLRQTTQELRNRDADIQTRDRVISQREKRLQELEQQLVYRQTEIDQLQQLADQSTAQLRLGVPAIVRNQTLAFGVAQATSPAQAREVIDAMLTAANRTALGRIQPQATNLDVPILLIEQSEIDLLLARLKDGNSYVIRILSAANYLLGEPLNISDRRGVQVFIVVAPNRQIFGGGEIVAQKSINNANALSNEEQQTWVNALINEANFRARGRGILAETSNVRYPAVQSVVDQLQQADGNSIEVQVIAAAPTTTAGPLKLEFVVLKAGQIVLRTQS
jgi:uncharacterized protein (DUF3084 family)